ncbi:MAG TPA: UDP-N-acetylglucosamine 2-epimerase (non-hydrolyzing) [Pyrinomonadaceae bacterium]|nr:UDP-N-acetylglucosamine 2-epimerase (non-hydrolyzing) [Pyrinomonadaceae bacterium]
MKVLTVIGARPQFIKAAPVSEALRAAGHQEFLVHTGQHYDYRMSKIFFEEIGLPEPDVNLEVGSGSHAWQTGQMLIGVEQVMSQQRPDCVLVYGDTNSTLAGALAASKLQFSIVHIEAGLRSFNREMPEEINRLLTDHCADVLFCPTQTAVDNLAREGITSGVHLVGDTMLDATLQFAETARRRSTILDQLNLESKRFLLATLHRPYNTDEPAKIRAILNAFSATGETVVFLVHPRTKAKIEEFGDSGRCNDLVKMMPPVGYLDTLMLEQHARMILTDSGGMQKEAYFFGVPCVTLRPETEWIETVESGWNVIAGSDSARIVSAVKDRKWPDKLPPAVFGDGRAAQHIVTGLAERAASWAARH